MGSLQVERILISDCYSLRVKIFYSIKNNSNPFQLDYSHDSILNFLATAFRNLSKKKLAKWKNKVSRISSIPRYPIHFFRFEKWEERFHPS